MSTTHEQAAACAELDRLAEARAAERGESFYDAYEAVSDANPELLKTAVRGAEPAPPRDRTLGKSAAGMSKAAADDALDRKARERAERLGEGYYVAYDAVAQANPELTKRAVDGPPDALLKAAVADDDAEQQQAETPVTAYRKLLDRAGEIVEREAVSGGRVVSAAAALDLAKRESPELWRTARAVYG